MHYEAVIGLEVHAQIHTRTKMFCGCPVLPDTGALEPNAAVCPVCLALPGTLPVVNRAAVEKGIATGLALGCRINPVSVFARKSYFYPDLPKGYQISQFELPLASDGYVDIETSDGRKRIGIRRAHLEEDAAKLYHLADGSAAVDFNRAGVPLIEIVSEPDLRSVEEVQAYATSLRDILVYLGVNTGDMEKGMMRFEANVSVRPVGTVELGIRTEVKNLNSFRALVQSVAYEIERHIELLSAGRPVVQQTMGWDETAGKTYPQREKEHAHDYRYFPEPDIPPLHIDRDAVQAIQSTLPELPAARRERFVTAYALRPYEARLLVSERAAADYFESAAATALEGGVSAQEVASWITGDLSRLLNETKLSIAACKVTPSYLAELLLLCHRGTVSTTAAKKVLEEVFVGGDPPAVVVERLGLAQISEEAAIRCIVQRVLEANPDQVQRYQDGKQGLIGWFVGRVMQASQGKANPQETRRLLEEALSKGHVS